MGGPARGGLSHVVRDLARAQITTDYQHIVRHLAGPFLPEIARIFPGHFQIVYLLTSFQRRQVWHACLARRHVGRRNPVKIKNPACLRERFLHEKSRLLLAEAYPEIPPGFEAALGRLGPAAQHPEIYALLHEFMAQPILRREINHLARIDARLLRTLARLPEPMRTVRMAQELADPRAAEAVVQLIRLLTNKPSTNGEDSGQVDFSPRRRRSAAELLETLYHATPFPKAPVAESTLCMHIDSAERMREIVAQYKNCLVNFIPEAIRGEYAFYEWKGSEGAIISIVPDRPYGWRLDDIKGIANAPVSDETVKAIEGYFSGHDVVARPPIEQMISRIQMRARRRRNQDAETVEQELDELFMELEEADF